MTGNSSKSGFGYSNQTKLGDVLSAIKIIKRYVDFRDRINKLLVALAGSGIDISRVNFNNPMSLISALSMAKQRGVDIDIDEILDDIKEDLEITLDDVQNALRTLRKYGELSRSVDSTLRVFSSTAKTSMEDLSSVAQMFGLKVPSHGKEEYIDESIEDEIPEEELEDIKMVVKKFRSGEL